MFEEVPGSEPTIIPMGESRAGALAIASAFTDGSPYVPDKIIVPQATAPVTEMDSSRRFPVAASELLRHSV